MPNWYAEDDDGHVRCYFDDKNGHELDECEVSHETSRAKWDQQEKRRERLRQHPLPRWLKVVANARVFVASQAYYDREDDDEYDRDYPEWDFTQW